MVDTLTFHASFTDVGTKDTHQALWDWGDGKSDAGSVSESGGSAHGGRFPHL